MNRSPLKSVAAAACAAALALSLAACGGDDDKEPSGTAASSTLDPVTAGYAAQVEPICAPIQADLTKIGQDFAAGDQSDAAFLDGLKRASERILGGIEEIRAVDVPAEVTLKAEAWLAAWEKAAKRMPKVTVAQARKGGIDLFSESDPFAEALGLGKCTSDGV